MTDTSGSMTQTALITLPHKNLHRVSADATVPSVEINQLVDDMQAVTLDWEQHRRHEFGVALAAVQINRLVRVIIIRSDFHDKDNHRFDVYINPVISRVEGEPVRELEGCLSVKDTYGEVARYPRVKIKALGLDGRPVKRVAKGFLARVFQHEIDHTHGITFVDRCGPTGNFFALQTDGSMQPLSRSEQQAFIKRVGVQPLPKETAHAH